jgi:hypothetical protein
MYYEVTTPDRPLVPGEIPGPDLKEEYHWDIEE